MADWDDIINNWLTMGEIKTVDVCDECQEKKKGKWRGEETRANTTCR